MNNPSTKVSRCRRSALGSAGFVATTLIGMWLVSAAASGATAFGDTTHPTESQPREFAPGVRIYWKARAVEVDAKIALRSGPLELFACSPQTREYESLLVVQARPMHIYQAMGLLGLEPGHPPRFDAKANRSVPAAGVPLSLAVRFGTGAKARFVDPSALMRATGKKPLSKNALRWVFSGSRTFENGRFGADVDGTVACVVDFDTALITVDALHSADNDKLWLEANTPEIPPIGTSCQLLIMSKRSSEITVKVSSGGRLSVDGRSVKPADVVKLYREYVWTGPSRPTVVLVPDGAAPDQVKSVSHTLSEAGVPSRPSDKGSAAGG